MTMNDKQLEMIKAVAKVTSLCDEFTDCRQCPFVQYLKEGDDFDVTPCRLQAEGKPYQWKRTVLEMLNEHISRLTKEVKTISPQDVKQ